jgi:hypothetical protein
MPTKHEKVLALAAAKGFPYKALTNKSTLLIRLFSESLKLPKNYPLMVVGEDGAFGTVYTTNPNDPNETVSGSVAVADYDAV